MNILFLELFSLNYEPMIYKHWPNTKNHPVMIQKASLSLVDSHLAHNSVMHVELGKYGYQGVAVWL